MNEKNESALLINRTNTSEIQGIKEEKRREGFQYPFLELRARPHHAVAYISAESTKLNMKRKNSRELRNLKMEWWYLGQINVEEEGLLGVRDLNAIFLIRIRDVDVVHSLCYVFHCSLSLSLAQPKNPNDLFINSHSQSVTPKHRTECTPFSILTPKARAQHFIHSSESYWATPLHQYNSTAIQYILIIKITHDKFAFRF